MKGLNVTLQTVVNLCFLILNMEGWFFLSLDPLQLFVINSKHPFLLMLSSAYFPFSDWKVVVAILTLGLITPFPLFPEWDLFISTYALLLH